MITGYELFKTALSSTTVLGRMAPPVGKRWPPPRSPPKYFNNRITAFSWMTHILNKMPDFAKKLTSLQPCKKQLTVYPLTLTIRKWDDPLAQSKKKKKVSLKFEQQS